MERAQWRTVKMIKGLERLSYKENLRAGSVHPRQKKAQRGLYQFVWACSSSEWRWGRKLFRVVFSFSFCCWLIFLKFGQGARGRRHRASEQRSHFCSCLMEWQVFYKRELTQVQPSSECNRPQCRVSERGRVKVPWASRAPSLGRELTLCCVLFEGKLTSTEQIESSCFPTLSQCFGRDLSKALC